MRVSFIRPSMMPGLASDALEPLVFAVLAGLTPPDVECVLHDERIEAIPFDERTDLAVLTVDTYAARRSYQIAMAYHRRGVPVVMGGYHPTLQTEEALQYATAVVVGDSEGVWADVLEDARKGALRRVYTQPRPSLDGLRFERRLFAGKRYGPLRLVQFGRGCRFACDFCSIHAFYGEDRSQRPIHEVAREIERLDSKYVFFTDDNLLADPARARALVQALLPLNIRWVCQVSLDIAAEPDLLRLMAQSGCRAVTVGFESLNESNLAQMGKRWNRAYGRYEELVRLLHDHGLMIYGTFVFGYDQDTVDAFAQTLEFALRSRLCLANFNPLTPMPGTPLTERLRAEGRLLFDPWWLDPDFRYGQSTFRPHGMTPEQLTEGCFWARTQFFRYSSIARRSLERANRRSASHAALFLTANVLSRREISRKQGRPLGHEGQLEPVEVHTS